MALETLTRDYLAALEDEAEHEAARQKSAEGAAAARATADALEAEIITEAKGGERFVLDHQLVTVDRGVVTIETVKNLDLVR